MDRLETIALFIAVAEAQGFVAAARKTGRSPAGVSRAIAALEEVLGQRLFNRTTRALSLTEAGEKLLERGRQLLADYDDMADALQGGGAPRGVLTLTAPVMFGRLHFMPIVRDFLREYPGIDVNLLLFDRILSLVDEGIDLGLRIGHLPDSSLMALRVGSVRRVLVAAPDYLAQAGTPQNPDELADHAFISTFGIASSPSHWSLGAEEDRMIRFRPRLTVNSVDAALDAAMSGLGVVRLFSYQVAEGVARGRLVRILHAFEPPAVPIHLVRPPGRAARKTALFMDKAASALRDKFGAEQDAPPILDESLG
ncbi:LysR family transcriptional regulator [Rhodoblastus acidophilus]|uniref:LysR family transcriptional regulator n=1 Tax=Candidatus Rhodoblastus alkanivorans TaxID=2954117 RepID=A0ABS9ZAA4_9HYPH|nr:LysR substrate-binding domain-containing protein [Candidatus Rhodoblastus alkanivorans]MCI4680551.1 LysR family transcriptional regulator [Candidatus Rhodoblastus alkanivorans]MCI4683986.1 LysR family transcriptional regulator [Candidatus Rhodoblastus alkanivorans]MDI4641305.1 LysR family transcriptional regulator [Rhodoblastus acidophilus]